VCVPVEMFRRSTVCVCNSAEFRGWRIGRSLQGSSSVCSVCSVGQLVIRLVLVKVIHGVDLPVEDIG